MDVHMHARACARVYVPVCVCVCSLCTRYGRAQAFLSQGTEGPSV